MRFDEYIQITGFAASLIVGFKLKTWGFVKRDGLRRGELMNQVSQDQVVTSMNNENSLWSSPFIREGYKKHPSFPFVKDLVMVAAH